ncbi:MAG: alpha/beta hydrolase [Clostridia bacterium]|nr:alpha/beta hydrolase [Clostridia bacterium]
MGIITNGYKKAVIHRYDDEGYIKYFCADDFEGLRSENYEFFSGKNRLAGKFYYYDGCKKDELVIFCHGLGGGHRSYMTEINLLCKRGFEVFTYDATGCFESEGRSILCLTQFLADLDSAVKSLKSDGIFQKSGKIYVVGHSLGGYAAGNILNYHADIDRIVVISGAISVKQIIAGILGGARLPAKKLALKRILAYENKMCPDYANSSLLDALAGNEKKYFFAHSTDDAMMPYSYSTGYIKDTVKPAGARFLIYTDRGHNPNYTADAVRLMNGVFGGFNKAVKEKKVKTFGDKKAYFRDADWVRMTAQDKDFWAQVIDFLHS